MESVNVGFEKAKAVAQEYGLRMAIPQFRDVSCKPTDFNDLHQLEGLEEVRRQVEAAEIPGEDGTTDIAKKLFPRGHFPWDVLPSSIADSLKQLARSCASSPTALPGVAVAILSSVIGSTVSVSPKASWPEPLIFWMCDIRASGEGKTPASRSLCGVLYQAQKEANDAYEMEMQEWDLMPKKEKQNRKPPAKPRGYFVTDLTLEGLREDHSGHGGKVCILDEVSAFISGQNQYKQKGSDRESWLCLHDGKPARVVRAGKTVMLIGARISIFGGIQPAVWRKAFSGESGGIYLQDGTIYRFLPIYEGPAFHPLTAESWNDENRQAWENLLKTAMRWSDNLQETDKEKILCLSEDAQQVFFDWRNELIQVKDDLPSPVRGFIPKLVGYALRFAGVLYLMELFSRDEEPGSILNVNDIQKGITVSEFYLGHIIQAMEALISEDAPEPIEITDQTIHLAQTLKALKPECENGLLAVGFIQERFNESCVKELRVNTPRAMGALLRRCGLTIPGGRFHYKEKHGVKCLKWDEKTNTFIRSCPQSPQSPQSEENQAVTSEDFKKEKSSQVLKNDRQGKDLRTLRTSRKQSPQGQPSEIIKNEDFEDNEDFISNVTGKKLPDLEEVVF